MNSNDMIDNLIDCFCCFPGTSNGASSGGASKYVSLVYTDEYCPPAEEVYVKEGREADSDVFKFVNRHELPPRPDDAVSWFAARKQWGDGLAKMGLTRPEYPIPFSNVSFMHTIQVCNPKIARLINKDLSLRSGLFVDPDGVQPYMGLLNVREALESESRKTKTITCDAHSGFIRHKADHNTWTVPDVTNLVKMENWLHRRFPGMPWYSSQTGKGIIIAGGFVLMCLFGLVKFDDDTGDLVKVPEGTDIDIFVIVEERLRKGRDLTEIAESIVKEVIRSVNPIGFTEHAHVVNIVTRMDDELTLQFQVVKSLQKTPSHTVNGFDIWGCMILYDGVKVHATEGAIHQITTGLMVADATKASKSWSHRLFKYAERYGFAIYFAGVLQRTIDRIGRDHVPMSNMNTFAHIAYSMRNDWIYNNKTSSDYTDPATVYFIEKIHGFSSPASYGKDAFMKTYCPWTLDMHDPRGHFTGSFNPVDTNPYAGLDRFIILMDA
jgi:hypothetical protein